MANPHPWITTGSTYGPSTTASTWSASSNMNTSYMITQADSTMTVLYPQSISLIAEIMQIDTSHERHETELADIREEYNQELKKTLADLLYSANPKLAALKSLYDTTKDSIDVANKLSTP